MKDTTREALRCNQANVVIRYEVRSGQCQVRTSPEGILRDLCDTAVGLRRKKQLLFMPNGQCTKEDDLDLVGDRRSGRRRDAVKSRRRWGFHRQGIDRGVTNRTGAHSDRDDTEVGSCRSLGKYLITYNKWFEN